MDDMDDCEVCLRPSIDPLTVTFAADDIETFAVRYCRECVTFVFERMAQRYRQAVADNNAAVGEMKRMFGIIEP